MSQSVSTKRSDRATGGLLACGVLAGPLFIVASAVQAFTRAGFDPRRHPPSLLSLGDPGWIQVTNFIVCGLLFIACAVGLRRSMSGRSGLWGPILIFAVGAAMLVGGLFVVDPGLGFPAGAPAGQPTTVSWHAAIHLSAFGGGFISMVAASFVLARRYAGLGRRRLTVYSLVVGVFLAAGFISVMTGLSGGNLLPLWAALVVGWTWSSVVAAQEMSNA